MAYEREAIPDEASSTAGPTIYPAMREERVLSPYTATPTRMERMQAVLNGEGEGSALPSQQKIGHSDVVRGPEEKKTEETVRLSPQLAALARREQKFRSMQQKLESERAAMAAEQEELAQLRLMKQKLAAKDYSGLDGLVDYNEYSQYQVNKLNGSDPVQDEVQKLRGKVEELEKFSKDNLSTQFEAAVQERRNAATELVQTSDQFPRTRKAGAQEAIVQHILDTWEHDNTELSVEQAAKEVEEVLVEKARQWAALLEDEKANAVQDTKKQLPPLKREPLKGITNKVTSASDPLRPPPRAYSRMSESERWAVARQRAEEKLQLTASR